MPEHFDAALVGTAGRGHEKWESFPGAGPVDAAELCSPVSLSSSNPQSLSVISGLGVRILHTWLTLGC